jgi:hypothetical protein
MLFLLNDVVLDLAQSELSPGQAAQRYRRLSPAYVESLGAELYAAYPMLQTTDPERALRLATMIVAVAPSINAALFVSPAFGCDPSEVTTRMDRIGLETLDELRRDQAAGKAIALAADKEVWKRLAA